MGKKYEIAKKLFDPVVIQEKQSNIFRYLMLEENLPYRTVIQEWASNFIDRDGKFITEFQTTFNSSFWELYIFAVLNEIGFKNSYNYPSPDFIFNDLIFECTISNPPDDVRANFAKLFLTASGEKKLELRRDMIEFSCVRLMNSISAKIKKYKEYYSKLDYVKNKPFIICITPFDQEHSQLQGTEAIIQCLYAAGTPLFMDDGNSNSISDRTFLGINLVKSVIKHSGTSIDTGLFCKPENSFVSAVLFSSTATISKVHTLSSKRDGSNFSVTRFNKNSKFSNEFIFSDTNYNETLVDGVSLFLNPFADIKFDVSKFQNAGIGVSLYSSEGKLLFSNYPDNFLLHRSKISSCIIGSEKHKILEDTRSKEKSRPLLTYQKIKYHEDQLVCVDAIHDNYKEQWKAYYKGWTIFVVQCSVDNDWGWLANNTKSSTMQDFITNNSKRGIITLLIEASFFTTKEEAFLDAKRAILNKLKNYGF
ncbi:hypothetical protein [Fluviispira multicolorata]|uniref:Uncharacterized protein n=1 Tax=Fluviispira multicolorata TaxID=2654512 RepID=A0A833JBU7_9BACT|nr:hypothetical protein [Fluviispira multicolorata]KAB8029876.1 hypothetical protein GCL57_10080 [Fluviispira multicolorata]